MYKLLLHPKNEISCSKISLDVDAETLETDMKVNNVVTSFIVDEIL
jgi:hypothetical protein